MARVKKVKAAVPPVDVPPPYVWKFKGAPVPEWALSSFASRRRGYFQTYAYTISQLIRCGYAVSYKRYVPPTIEVIDLDHVLRLPAFQRGVVWSPEQQTALCNSVFGGVPCPALYLWRRYQNGRSRTYVLDGQQRLTALGVPLLRADGTLNPPAPVLWDLDSGEFWPGRPDPTDTAIMPQRIELPYAFWGKTGVDQLMRQANDMDDDISYQRMWRLVGAADSFFQRCLPVIQLDDFTPADVVAIFRAINRPGVTYTEAEIEALVASCSWEE